MIHVLVLLCTRFLKSHTLFISKVPEDAVVEEDDGDEPEEVNYYESAVDGEADNAEKVEKKVRNLVLIALN